MVLITTAAALLFVGSMGAEAARTHRSVADRIPAEHNRVLRAATKRSAHEKRSFRIEQKFEVELPYVEEETKFDGHSIFASQLRVTSKRPILNLEDIEHHLNDVKCEDGKMTLEFFDPAAAADATGACHDDGEGAIIVTSHEGCNDEGERVAYSVNDLTALGDGSILELAVKKTLFEHAFDTVDVGFGHTEEIHDARDHSVFKLRRRQLAGTGGVDAERIVKGVKSADDVLKDIGDEPKVGEHEVKFNLNWEMSNATFRPDQILYGLPVGMNLQNIANMPIELSCKKCLTMGDIKLTQGEIKIDTAALRGIPDQIKKIPGMVASAVPSLINAIPEKMDKVGEKIESAAAPAVSAVTSLVDAGISKVESKAAEATSAIASIIDSVPDKVGDIVDKVPDIIPDIPDIKLPKMPWGRRGEKALRSERAREARKVARAEKAKRDGFNLGKVITGGFVELEANNLEAYFEMGAAPKSTGQFTFYLLDLPILGFSIPGVGHAGAIMEVLLEADYEFEGGFNLTYGMNLVVPPKSTMRIDLGDMSKSGVKGFQDAVLTPIPFKFEQKALDGFVSLALAPGIPIGFKFMSIVDVGIEADMELPRLDAMVSTIMDADTKCNDISPLPEEEEGGEEGDEELEEGEEGDEELAEGDEGDEELAEGDEGDEELAEGDEGDEELAEGDEGEEALDDTEAGDEAVEEDEELAKRSEFKRNVNAIRAASKARRAPANRAAKKARALARRQEEAAEEEPAEEKPAEGKPAEEKPTPTTNVTNPNQPAKLELVYIEWNVSMAVELGFNFVLPGMPQVIPGVDTNALVPFKPIKKHTKIFHTVNQMPTQCLAPKEGWKPATAVYSDPPHATEVADEGEEGEEELDGEDETAADEDLDAEDETAADEDLDAEDETAADEDLDAEDETAADEDLDAEDETDETAADEDLDAEDETTADEDLDATDETAADETAADEDLDAEDETAADEDLDAEDETAADEDLDAEDETAADEDLDAEDETLEKRHYGSHDDDDKSDSYGPGEHDEPKPEPGHGYNDGGSDKPKDEPGHGYNDGGSDKPKDEPKPEPEPEEPNMEPEEPEKLPECGGYGQPECGNSDKPKDEPKPEPKPEEPNMEPEEPEKLPECGGYGQPACDASSSAPPPPETTTESAPPPPESTPECGGGYGQPPCEESSSASSPPETTTESAPPPPESTTEPATSEPATTEPATSEPATSEPATSTPVESTPVESTPVSSNVESTPSSSAAESTPCTTGSTTTPPPAPPSSSPCTTGTTLTVTLPWNTTSSTEPAPPTATPPEPSAPIEYHGAATSMTVSTFGTVLFGLLAFLML